MSSVTCAAEPLEIVVFQRRRLRSAGVIVPSVLFIAAVTIATSSTRLGLIPLAVALGWTQLVGL
jgi:hypothetical protein